MADAPNDPPTPIIASGSIPSRLELMSQDKADNPELVQQLSLRSPADLEHVPPTLAFDRVREISLPWADLMEGMSKIAKGAMGPSRALRAYFETSWWDETKSAPTEKELQQLFDDGLIIVLPEAVAEEETPVYDFHRYIRTEVPQEEAKKDPFHGLFRAVQYAMLQVDAPAEEKPKVYVDDATPLTEGVILREAISGRYYLIETHEPLTDPEALKTPKGYQQFWEDLVESAMIVGNGKTAAISAQSHYQELDLRAPFIERRYAELSVFEEVANAINTKVSGALDGLLELGMGRELDFSAFEEVQERYVNARLGPERIQRLKRLLKKQAASMDYILFLGDEPEMTLKFPDGAEHTATAGQLYRTVTRTCHWSVTYKKAIIGNAFESAWFGVKRLFGGAKDKPTKTYSEPRSQLVQDYERVDTLTDPLSAKIRAFQEGGREAFVFEETPGGYVTGDGQALTTIMARCQYDEAFRQKCVVMIPVFEQGFSVVKPVVAYHIFERPLPGIVPMRMPRMFVSESLSYRTAWKGVELGELVSTINLTPGEEREMTITRSITRESSEARSTSSVIELASSETTDIATEMERIARTENEFTASANSEVTTGSSTKDSDTNRNVLDGLTSLITTATTGTSSSSYKFGASDTLKTFSQSMNKVAKKAATSVTRSSKQEISTSSSETTTVSSTDSTVIKLANINKGRTLNLMFHRVYNRYAAGLFIDDLRFGVTEGTELIAGSGIFNTRNYSPNQIGAMIGVLVNAPLPFDVTGDALNYFQDKVIDTLLETVDAEYLESTQRRKGRKAAANNAGEDDAEGETASVLSAPPRLLTKLTEARERTEPTRKTAPNVPSAREIRTRIAELEEDFADIRLKSRALGGANDGSSDLLVAAQGLYLDSMLGARPATEPYSEEMRTQEIRKSAAEVLRAEADADYTRAQAMRVAAQRGAAPGSGNVLTGVHLLDDPKVLTLGFLMPLPAGDWVICDNGDPVPGGDIPPDQFHRTTIVIKPPRRTRHGQTWLSAPNLMQRITVRNRETEEEIGPV